MKKEWNYGQAGMTTKEELVPKIIGLLVSRLEERGEGGELPQQLDGTTPLIGGQSPIDSLDLATIVIEMEELTGRDPFRDGFSEFRTVGDLAKLFTG